MQTDLLSIEHFSRWFIMSWWSNKFSIPQTMFFFKAHVEKVDPSFHFTENLQQQRFSSSLSKECSCQQHVKTRWYILNQLCRSLSPTPAVHCMNWTRVTRKCAALSLLNSTPKILCWKYSGIVTGSELHKAADVKTGGADNTAQIIRAEPTSWARNIRDSLRSDRHSLGGVRRRTQTNRCVPPQFACRHDFVPRKPYKHTEVQAQLPS